MEPGTWEELTSLQAKEEVIIKMLLLECYSDLTSPAGCGVTDL